MNRYKIISIFRKSLVFATLSLITLFGAVYGCVYIHSRYEEYIIIDQIDDENTGLVVEFGVTPGRFTDVGFYSVKVFETKKKSRKKPAFNNGPITIKRGDGVPSLTYDGKCYIFEYDGEAVYAYEKEWSNFWGDKKLCFELRKRTEISE